MNLSNVSVKTLTRWDIRHKNAYLN